MDWGGDHLAGHAADGVGGDGQFRRNANGRSSGALHAGEEGVGGGVETGEEHAQPMSGAKKGKRPPVLVKARPRVELMPA